MNGPLVPYCLLILILILWPITSNTAMLCWHIASAQMWRRNRARHGEHRCPTPSATIISLLAEIVGVSNQCCWSCYECVARKVDSTDKILAKHAKCLVMMKVAWVLGYHLLSVPYVVQFNSFLSRCLGNKAHWRICWSNRTSNSEKWVEKQTKVAFFKN